MHALTCVYASQIQTYSFDLAGKGADRQSLQSALQVAKPDFGSLLKTQDAAQDAAQAGGSGANGTDTGPHIGTILWYNGRRKSGILLADRDRSQHRRSAATVSAMISTE